MQPVRTLGAHLFFGPRTTIFFSLALSLSSFVVPFGLEASMLLATSGDDDDDFSPAVGDVGGEELIMREATLSSRHEHAEQAAACSAVGSVGNASRWEFECRLSANDCFGSAFVKFKVKEGEEVQVK